MGLRSVVSPEKLWPTVREFGKIIFYLIVTVLVGTLLAPPLYWGGQGLAHHGILPWLAQVDFRRFFHRGILIAALALLWPVARWLKISNVRALGLAPNARYGRDLAAGFGCSFLTVALLGVVLLRADLVDWNAGVPWKALGNVAISAVVVSLVEEWLFRGAILGLLARTLPEGVALAFASALFSVVHFLRPPGPSPVTGGIRWFSGFALIPDAVSRFREPSLVLGGFVTLFCIGWILGWSRLRTRSLAMAMGLHAGWVLGVMSFEKLTHRTVESMAPWFGADLSTGLGAVMTVLAAWAPAWAWVNLGPGRKDR